MTSKKVFGFRKSKDALRSGYKDIDIVIRNSTSLNCWERKSSFTSFAQVLAANETCEKLRIFGRISSNINGAEGAKVIALALAKNTKLKELVIRYSLISDEGAKAISEAIRENPNSALTSLDLESNEIGPQGAKEIGLLLRSNKAISKLSLSRNRIKDAGVINIAVALKEHDSLEVLCLRSCFIGNKGAVQLADSLKLNNSLRSFDLAFNLVGDEGAEKLAEAIVMNKTIQEIKLIFNSFSSRGVDRILSAFEKNQHIDRIIDEAKFRRCQDGNFNPPDHDRVHATPVKEYRDY
uniref:Uncharacterized protein n=1 Tax=Aplanochytrium stocchinoi TaxID=215587 RepID=A0A7S3PRP4_9STRA|mmetsp:Transcript_15094/g.18665  ORF Transcript_15094/g.18665 Transcript_15094/m.18665 type:complete len:294 (-) Transcript_15094:285-1166(-)|eukprot:CAMPEP_0204830150 /NCGR_PEP_ID=MMETSP1346-20131115/8362_1 /ASSEMBLY_ACC=CAM_ASM_000771 /TAXON_ID=215587 /ORGANISM="Aplanochytrium stocchinoi, Strain GSBS06" /LENGTH=293 /DNA_ID=CAMNT_0051960293 /DNA_START=346 /DNA_END=1227 /DNA_ORIENTATION=+